MRYVITGFTHDLGFRVFQFDCLGDRSRTQCTVRADLALARKHGLPMQELPILCRALLERDALEDDVRTLTFTEEEMRVCAGARVAAKAAAASKRKPPHRPSGENLGAAWRGHASPPTAPVVPQPGGLAHAARKD